MAWDDYTWPPAPLADAPRWLPLDSEYLSRSPSDTAEELEADSRWPAFMSQPICLVTVRYQGRDYVERVVGPSIVNRFPLIVAVSFCLQRLSRRHYPRRRFVEALRASGRACVQFLPQTEKLQAVLNAITAIDDDDCDKRLNHSGVATRRLPDDGPAVIETAYVAYDVESAVPHQDMYGNLVNQTFEHAVGSHALFLMEVRRILLLSNIAAGRQRVLWRSLASWQTDMLWGEGIATETQGKYTKGYTTKYFFPDPGARPYDGREEFHEYSVLAIERANASAPEMDPDKARWPCFFPSSVGMISTRGIDGIDNVTPCGSTAVVGRFPLTFSVCMAYAEFNERYTKRGCITALEETGKFGCGVPFDSPEMVRVIRHLGNTSIQDFPDKVKRSGATLADENIAGVVPVIRQLPVHFDFSIISQIKMGSHIMFLGRVERILVRRKVMPKNPIVWSPWAQIVSGVSG